MSVWILQHSIKHAKEKAYKRTKDERIFWISPFRLVSLIAGNKQCDEAEIDSILTRFLSNTCSVEQMAELFKVFNTWADKFQSKIALRAIAKPEEKSSLENLTHIWRRYYRNAEKDVLNGIPEIEPWVKKFSGNIGKHYHRFLIPKKDGHKRVIEAPVEELSSVQRIVLKEILYPCYPFAKFNPCHGFLPGKNVLSNANVHSNACIIVNLDLKEAFTSTKESILIPALEDYFTEKGANLLIKLCCLKGRLPQGAPSSPMLLNYALLKIDKRLRTISKCMGWRYSRYADDLTFSCEKLGEHTAGAGKLIEKIGKDIIKEFGYRLNEKKIRVFRPKRAMMVTGLVLNSGEPTISRKLRRILRAKVHNFVTKGIGEIKEILGHLSFVSLVHKDYASNLKDKLNTHQLAAK